MELRNPRGNLPNPAGDHIWGNAGWSFFSLHPLVVQGQNVFVSNVFNWRFVRLNEAFASLNPSVRVIQERAVFVYFDLVRSNLVGDTLTDLLRIVPYKEQAQWWEPEQIEFYPLCGPSMTIVEVNLAWYSGNLLAFPPKSVCHLRLLFRVVVVIKRVVLLSDVTLEFRDNTPDAFKVRLAEPMAFDGDWEAALTSLSTRDSERTWGPQQEVMFSGLFTLEKPGQPSIHVITEHRTRQLQDQTLITNGVDLMWSMVWAFEKEAFSQAQTKGVPLKNSTRVTFRWEGETLVMENKRLSDIKKPFMAANIDFMVKASLAVVMGWLSPDQTQLGENLYYTLTRPPIPSSLPRRRRLDKMISGKIPEISTKRLPTTWEVPRNVSSCIGPGGQ